MAQLSPNWLPNATLVLPSNLKNGGSRPKLCDFDDLVRRIVKWHPSSHGQTSTYSELVASRLGLLIESPLIRGTLVYVEHDLLPVDIRDRINQPYHVGFTYAKGENFLADDYEGLGNRDALPAAAVHLAWLHMGDQEGHNQYLRRIEETTIEGEVIERNEFCLIDQAEICGSGNWTNATFGRPDLEYRLPKHLREHVIFEDIEPVLEKVSQLEEDEIRSCLEFYPDEWEIDQEAVERLAGYLLERRGYLQTILQANLPFLGI